MSSNKGPVIVTLSCEARPSTEQVEVDRAEWEAMTPAQRRAMLDDDLATHIANAGGGSWWIDDPEDAADAEGPDDAPRPDPLRELAEWLVSLDEPGNIDRRTVNLNQIIERARQALGKED